MGFTRHWLLGEGGKPTKIAWGQRFQVEHSNEVSESDKYRSRPILFAPKGPAVWKLAFQKLPLLDILGSRCGWFGGANPFLMKVLGWNIKPLFKDKKFYQVRYCEISAKRKDSDHHDIIDLTAFNTDGFDVTGHKTLGESALFAGLSYFASLWVLLCWFWHFNVQFYPFPETFGWLSDNLAAASLLQRDAKETTPI